ncbi:hypothetical protein L1987_78281 [Smallanthus sonchifolius]|uniref:Uncharacterized protein n=1 Tax=Smallanthus sonchifolius TaxID=185202 RepID=A0ACB8ZC07_9ASTR|nr:hypothetical protein L1987_78281 [Smallanthus sonchifolius]
MLAIRHYFNPSKDVVMNIKPLKSHSPFVSWSYNADLDEFALIDVKKQQMRCSSKAIYKMPHKDIKTLSELPLNNPSKDQRGYEAYQQHLAQVAADRLISSIQHKLLLIGLSAAVIHDIRTVLALGGRNDDPISLPNTLIMGCFQRMGYRGRQNDTQARKGGLVGQWRYFMHVIIQCLSPRKAGTDGLKTSLQAAMVALTLNRPFKFANYFYRELVMQITPPEGQGFLMYPPFLQI